MPSVRLKGSDIEKLFTEFEFNGTKIREKKMLSPSWTSLPFFPAMGTSPSEWRSLRSDFAIICIGKKVTKYSTIPLSKKKLIDTDGVGDVYVEGCLSVFVHEEKCDTLCAVYCICPNVLVQQSGFSSCQSPDEGNAEHCRSSAM